VILAKLKDAKDIFATATVVREAIEEDEEIGEVESK
jgi:hypothetical protein